MKHLNLDRKDENWLIAMNFVLARGCVGFYLHNFSEFWQNYVHEQVVLFFLVMMMILANQRKQSWEVWAITKMILKMNLDKTLL